MANDMLSPMRQEMQQMLSALQPAVLAIQANSNSYSAQNYRPQSSGGSSYGRPFTAQSQGMMGYNNNQPLRVATPASSWAGTPRAGGGGQHPPIPGPCLHCGFPKGHHDGICYNQNLPAMLERCPGTQMPYATHEQLAGWVHRVQLLRPDWQPHPSVLERIKHKLPPPGPQRQVQGQGGLVLPDTSRMARNQRVAQANARAFGKGPNEAALLAIAEQDHEQQFEPYCNVAVATCSMQAAGDQGHGSTSAVYVGTRASQQVASTITSDRFPAGFVPQPQSSMAPQGSNPRLVRPQHIAANQPVTHPPTLVPPVGIQQPGGGVGTVSIQLNPMHGEDRQLLSQYMRRYDDSAVGQEAFVALAEAQWHCADAHRRQRDMNDTMVTLDYVIQSSDSGLWLMADEGVGPKQLRVVFDTGAQMNIITPGAADMLGCSISPSDLAVKTVDGSALPTMGVIPELTCVLNRGAGTELTLTISAAVMGGGPAPLYDVLLGKDVIRKLGARIDYVTQTLQYRRGFGTDTRGIWGELNLSTEIPRRTRSMSHASVCMCVSSDVCIAESAAVGCTNEGVSEPAVGTQTGLVAEEYESAAREDKGNAQSRHGEARGGSKRAGRHKGGGSRKVRMARRMRHARAMAAEQMEDEVAPVRRARKSKRKQWIGGRLLTGLVSCALPVHAALYHLGSSVWQRWVIPDRDGPYDIQPLPQPKPGREKLGRRKRAQAEQAQLHNQQQRSLMQQRSRSRGFGVSQRALALLMLLPVMQLICTGTLAMDMSHTGAGSGLPGRFVSWSELAEARIGGGVSMDWQVHGLTAVAAHAVGQVGGQEWQEGEGSGGALGDGAGQGEGNGQSSQWWHPSPSALDLLTPLGESEQHHEYEHCKDAEFGWTWGHHPAYTAEQFQSFKGDIVACNSAFARSMCDIKGYSGPVGDAVIDMVDSRPIRDQKRRYSPLEQAIQDEKCKELLEANFIEKAPPDNPYASCPVMAAKRDPETGEWTGKRFCIDLRRINANCKDHSSRPPLPETLFRKLEGRTVFSTIDLRSGFHNIPLTAESKKATAFYWGNDVYQYTRLCFGLKTATALFQERIDDTLSRHGLADVAFAFVDDVMIASTSLEQHGKDCAAVLRALEADGWSVHPDKSTFGARTVAYLGHLITPNGIEPLEAKCAAIKALPSPANLEQLRSQLGVMNFYRSFLPGFSVTAAPLHKLLGKGVAYVWGEEQELAMHRLKVGLTTLGVGLRHPQEHLPFYVYSDWSVHGIAGQLVQKDEEGRFYLVACFSRSCNKHERGYLILPEGSSQDKM